MVAARARIAAGIPGRLRSKRPVHKPVLILETRPDSCARAANGNKAAALPMNMMKSRRLIASPKAEGIRTS
jgi:hypothetical protein